MPDTITLPTLTQIGTVEIRRLRVYPIPGGELSDKNTAQVEPGHYPVVRQDDGSVFWIMEARKNTHEVEFGKVPEMEGTFFVSQNDRASGRPFMLASKVFDADDFADFADECAAEEDGALRFTLTA